MQYFVFHITSSNSVVKNLKKLNSFDKYKDAKFFAREQRAALNGEGTVKVIFAENELNAEEMLQVKREAPILEEWEK